jgi:phage terminase large subunit
MSFQDALAGPVSFFEDIMRIKPTDQQVEVLETVMLDLYDPTPGHQPKRRLTIASGAGIGKTTTLAGLALWFGLRAPRTAVYMTAPTMRQVQEVFFAELRRSVARGHPHLAKITNITSRVCRFYNDKLWHITGVSASKSENIQGLHQDNMVFLVDEASGVDSPIMEAILATLTNEHSYLICTGNPNTRQCEFFQYFYGPTSDDWHKLTFSSEDSPIADKKNIERLERQFGRESDEFRVRVLGKFPKSDSTSIIERQDLHTAANRPDPWVTPPGHSFRYSIGIDIAGEGADESVIVARCGGHVAAMQIFLKQEPDRVIQAAFALQHRFQWDNDETVYVFDATGMGHGRRTIFKDNNKNVFMFTFNSKARKQNQFDNRITEGWFELRNQLKSGTIKLPYDPTLWQQLTSRRYEFRGDKLFVEPKKQWRKRTKAKASCDRADAVVLAFYPHTKLKLLTPDRERPSSAPTDYATPAPPQRPQGHRRRRIRVNNQ